MNKIELLKKMIEENQDNATAWFLLGIEYQELEQTNKSLSAFAEALKYADEQLREKVILQLNNISSKEVNEGVKHDSTSSEEEWIEDNFEEHIDIEQKFKEKAALRVINGGKEDNQHIVEFKRNRIKFEDVGGLEELKNTIRMKIIKPFTNPGLFAKYRKKSGGGILLFGPPGCGKTFIARATAGEVKANFSAVHITDILDPFLGVSEQNIKDIFTTAHANNPTVLFFDEIDSLGYNRAKSSSHMLRPMVDQLLSEMEGIDSSTDQILIIGATNMPWDIDPAFLRPGRFDRVIFVPPPDKKARERIFQLKLKDRPVETIDIQKLSLSTELYSGADIENVVEVATENVISEIMSSELERPIKMEDLLNAIKNTKPSTIEWLKTIKNYVKYSNQSGLFNDVAIYLEKYKKMF